MGQRLLVKVLYVLPFFLEIKLSAGQGDINRSGLHLLENVLKGKRLIPPPPPHLLPANWSAEAVAEDKRAGTFTEPGSLTTWSTWQHWTVPRLLFYVRKKKATVRLFWPLDFLVLVICS